MKYYQGYHDITTVFLLTLPTNLAFYCLEAFTETRLLEFMTKSFTECLVPHLKHVENRIEDPNLKNLVTDSGNFEFMMFATSWLLTMFAHDIEKFESLQRLFDALIAGGDTMIYSVIL